jgi:CDP-diacylglycerol--glycerol-3-phosphate 3-phosphatidyltransferase
MPPPRRSKGVTGPALRFVFAWPYRVILAGLYRAGVRPWQLTVASLLLNLAAGGALLGGERLLAGMLLFFAGACDVFDGGVARLRGEEKRSGAFLDSVLDRIGDMVLFSCLFWAESGQGHWLNAWLSLVTLVTALGVSHIRAEAEAAGVELSEGLFQRLERYVAMIVGLIVPGALTPMLVLLSVLGTVTVVQRMWSALVRIAARSSGTA